MNKFSVAKLFEAKCPINKYNVDIEVELVCELLKRFDITDSFFCISVVIKFSNGTSTSHTLHNNDNNKHQLYRFFPEYTYLLKWLNWSVKGPTNYDFVNDTLDSLCSKEIEPPKYKDFVTVDNIPLLYTLEPALISYINTNGLDSLKNTEVIELKNPDNCKVSSLYSIGEYTKEWKNCPFKSRLEAQSFIDTINNHELRTKRILIKSCEKTHPDLNKAKELALLNKVSDSSFTEKNLKKRLTLLIRQFKADLINIGLSI